MLDRFINERVTLAWHALSCTCRKRTGKRISHALRDMLPFVQFKKCEKHPWRSVRFSKVASYLVYLTMTARDVLSKLE